jgi:hypothetical protein
MNSDDFQGFDAILEERSWRSSTVSFGFTCAKRSFERGRQAATRQIAADQPGQLLPA